MIALESQREAIRHNSDYADAWLVGVMNGDLSAAIRKAAAGGSFDASIACESGDVDADQNLWLVPESWANRFIADGVGGSPIARRATAFRFRRAADGSILIPGMTDPAERHEELSDAPPPAEQSVADPGRWVARASFAASLGERVVDGGSMVSQQASESLRAGLEDLLILSMMGDGIGISYGSGIGGGVGAGIINLLQQADPAFAEERELIASPDVIATVSSHHKGSVDTGGSRKSIFGTPVIETSKLPASPKPGQTYGIAGDLRRGMALGIGEELWARTSRTGGRIGLEVFVDVAPCVLNTSALRCVAMA